MARNAWSIATVLVIALGLSSSAGEAAHNVIVMVPDGTSWSLQTLARWAKGKPLTLDPILVGAVRTSCASSVVTDSAAAATAFACGQKTSAGFIAVGPRVEGVLSIYPPPPAELTYKPLATVLEGARLEGKATGVVVTTRFTDATPGAFVAHTASRSGEYDIAEQLVYQGVDVALGGGKDRFLPKGSGGTRADGENLIEVLKGRGYQVVQTPTELAGVTRGPVFGFFAQWDMSPDLDRVTLERAQPSLAEVTAKAIQLLAQDPDGFFLLVEGSQMDLAGHMGDAVMAVTELLAFDQAVQVALDFAAEDGDTLVLALPDHGTGGVSLGNATSSGTYSQTSIEALLAPLQRMRLTGTGLAGKIGADLSAENLKARIAEWWGIQASDAEVTAILGRVAWGQELRTALAAVLVPAHTLVGFTTSGHDGGDVPLWAFGPGRPAGSHDNTELAWLVAMALGFDLAAADRHLFVDLTRTFPESVVDLADPTNPVIRVGEAALPVGKNLLIWEPRSLVVPLDGVVVLAPETHRAYAPRLAVTVIRLLRQLPGWVSAAEVQALARQLESGGDSHLPVAPEPRP